MDLSALVPEFASKMAELLRNCATRGFELVPYFTLRDPHVQARLWRQSRGGAEIDQEIARLVALGAPWLAGVLRSAPHSTGPWATNAVPGDSWHQWGEAVDCYWKGADGSAVWRDGPGYAALASEAIKLGLTPGRGFHMPDIDHVQFRAQGAPSDVYAWPDIDAKMKARFGG